MSQAMQHQPLQGNNSPRPLGFPQEMIGTRPGAVVRPTPLPARPKGRWFIALLLIALSGWAGYHVWNSYFRFQAYGTVTGQVLEVAPPWEGVVRYLHVREGEKVRQGQPLVTVDNVELRQRHAQLSDELRIAQANLDAEVAQLKWQSAFGLDQSRGAVALYYETLGNYLREEARLEELKQLLRRSQILYGSNAISQEEYQQYLYAKQGQEQKLVKLKDALNDLKKRADQVDALLKKRLDLSGGLAESGNEQLKPGLAKIEALKAERARLQERLDQGQILAPANGIVLKHLRLAGAHCRSTEPLLTILEEGSLQVVLYLPQDKSIAPAIGAAMELVADFHDEPLICSITRLGDQCESAPEHIKRHYWEGQKLVPVYLRVSDEQASRLTLRVGSVVKLPYRKPALLSGIQP